MRLRSVLREAKNKMLKAENLETLLNTSFISDLPPNQILYRGYKDDIDTFKVKKIRNDRKPLDTPLYLQELVDLMADDLNREFPKRSESKFATQSKSSASIFGNAFYSFPEKNSNIVSRKKDSWDESLIYVDDRIVQLKKLYQDLDKSSISENLKTVTENFIKAKSSFDRQKVKSYIEKAYKLWKNHESQIKNSAFEHGLDDIVEAFNLIKTTYFDKFSRGVPPGSSEAGEIMFDGDNYLLVNISFFKENFSWNGNSWKLKKRY